MSKLANTITAAELNARLSRWVCGLGRAWLWSVGTSCRRLVARGHAPSLPLNDIQMNRSLAPDQTGTCRLHATPHVRCAITQPQHQRGRGQRCGGAPGRGGHGDGQGLLQAHRECDYLAIVSGAEVFAWLEGVDGGGLCTGRAGCSQDSRDSLTAVLGRHYSCAIGPTCRVCKAHEGAKYGAYGICNCWLQIPCSAAAKECKYGTCTSSVLCAIN